MGNSVQKLALTKRLPTTRAYYLEHEADKLYDQNDFATGDELNHRAGAVLPRSGKHLCGLSAVTHDTTEPCADCRRTYTVTVSCHAECRQMFTTMLLQWLVYGCCYLLTQA